MNKQAPSNESQLHVVMYHYVRDLPRTRYPGIKGMLLSEFRQQIQWLTAHFEMISLEGALEFLQGTYRPKSDLCMLTFDDGLKEHYTDVTPILAEHNIQGLFGVITSCVEEHVVAPVHMNHFLTAQLDLEIYRSAFLRQLRESAPDAYNTARVDPMVARKSYPLDTPDAATFKFLFNFTLEQAARDRVVTMLFEEYIGKPEAFARELYMSWDEIRQIQRAGMLVAGHTHSHRPLSMMGEEELNADLRISKRLLDQNTEPQELWPFSYPYGKKNSYSEAAIGLLQELGFTCAFNTEAGASTPGDPAFELHRIDCKGAISDLEERVAGHAEVTPGN